MPATLLADHHKIALILPDQSISYAQLLAMAQSYACLIPAETERVLIFAENRAEWLYAFYAAWASGCTVVPVDYQATAEEVAWEKDENGRFRMISRGQKETLKADLILLALGFVHPVHEGLLDELGVDYDARGNVAVDKQHGSNIPGVFAAGDTIMGASLVVKAIASGRKVAEDIHRVISTR